MLAGKGIPKQHCESLQVNCTRPRMIVLSKHLEKHVVIRVPLICYTYLLNVYVAETLGVYDWQRHISYQYGTHKNTVSRFCFKMITTLMALPIIKKYGMSPSLQGFNKVSLSCQYKAIFLRKYDTCISVQKTKYGSQNLERGTILIEMLAFRVVCYRLKVYAAMEARSNCLSAIRETAIAVWKKRRENQIRSTDVHLTLYIPEVSHMIGLCLFLNGYKPSECSNFSSTVLVTQKFPGCILS